MKVSIIVNCYNGESYLDECLSSIKDQTYKNYEVIFFDNNSNDKSAFIFKNYESEKFKYFKSDRKKNLYDARNDALGKCSGEIITFLDVDDVWHKNKLFEQTNIFQRDKDIDLIYTDYILKNELNNTTKNIYLKKIDKDLTNILLKQTNIALLTIAIRKKALEENNFKFDPDYNIIGDFDLLIKLSTKCKFFYLNFLSATYRQHSKSETNINFYRLIEELKDWKIKNHDNKMINSLSNFKNLDYKINYYNSIYAIKEKNYELLFKSLYKIKFSIYILRIIFWKIFR